MAEKIVYLEGHEDRTLQVFACMVCGHLTNRVQVTPRVNPGTQYVCPSEGQDWHKLLKKKKQMLRDPHPSSYRKEMIKEIEEIVRLHRPGHDVVGNAENNKKGHIGMRGEFVPCTGKGDGFYHHDDLEVEISPFW